MAAESALHRGHPIEERWQTPDVPVPQAKAGRQAEHQRLVDAEAAESLATGTAPWQVLLSGRKPEGSGRQGPALPAMDCRQRASSNFLANIVLGTGSTGFVEGLVRP